MDMLTTWLSEYYMFLTLALLGAFLVAFIVFGVVIMRLRKLSRQYRTLLTGMDGKNLEGILLKNTGILEDVLIQLKHTQHKVAALEKESYKSLKRVGLVRFNAFNEVGGDLSYAIALLNEGGNGFVICSIYGRDDARTYAKLITQGKSTYPLSSEEEKAILKALGEN